MLRKSECPYLICRSGLWYIVRAGCIGTIRVDELNKDRKVWFTECRSCYQARLFLEKEQGSE